MIVKMLPEQVERSWGLFSKTIDRALPDSISNVKNGFSNLLMAILSEEAQVWGVFDTEGNVFCGAVVTFINIHKITRVRRLEIFAAAGNEHLSMDMLIDGIDVLKKYARAHGCVRIIADSKNEALVRFLRQQGADTEATFITLEV